MAVPGRNTCHIPKWSVTSGARVGDTVASRVDELFIIGEQSDQREVPDGLVVHEEMEQREDRLARLAQANSVAHSIERAAAQQADDEARLDQRVERERTTGRRPGDHPPTPPVPGPHDSD